MSPVTRTLLVAAVATAAAATATLATDAKPEETAEEIGDVGVLFPDEGADLAYAYCAGCHSEMLVAQQGQTREGWDKLLKWMVEEQGMSPIPQEDRKAILDYLARHYNTDRPHFPPDRS